MRVRWAVLIVLVGLLVIPASVLAVTPLAVPAYELVNFNAGEIQNVGFSGGRA